MSGSGDERQHRAPHRRQRRLVDVDVIDLAGIGGGHRPGDRVAHDALEEALALGGRHELGIADAGNVAVRVQHDRRRHDRPGQTAAPDLVHAGHVAEADASQRVLQRAHGRHANHRNLKPEV